MKLWWSFIAQYQSKNYGQDNHSEKLNIYEKVLKVRLKVPIQHQIFIYSDHNKTKFLSKKKEHDTLILKNYV